MAKKSEPAVEAEPAKTQYYHLTMARLAPGSIIYPGNWGRLLRRYENDSVTGQVFGNSWILARELKYELVRVQHYPSKPSRFDVAF